MATDTDVKNFLGELLNAYPAFEPKDPQGFLDLWIRKFSGYSSDVLKRAASQWIDRGNRFFPSLPEIKSVVDGAAQQLASAYDYDPLRAEAIHLQDIAAAGEFDEQAWFRLASQFERIGRHSAAETLLINLERARAALALPAPAELIDIVCTQTI